MTENKNTRKTQSLYTKTKNNEKEKKLIYFGLKIYKPYLFNNI